MEIHLIRHTAIENPDNLCYGFAEMSLRKDYNDDFKRIQIDKDFDLVISSPSQRCQLLAKYFQLHYETDERIREMNFGDWELKKWSEIPEEEINPWYEDFINVKAKNGENLLEMQSRVSEFWNELISKKYQQSFNCNACRSYSADPSIHLKISSRKYVQHPNRVWKENCNRCEKRVAFN